MPQFNIQDMNLSADQIATIKSLLGKDQEIRLKKSGWVKEPEKPLSIREVMDRCGIKQVHWVLRTDNPVNAFTRSGKNTFQVTILTDKPRTFLIPSDKIEFEDDESVIRELKNAYNEIARSNNVVRAVNLSRFDGRILTQIENVISFNVSDIKARKVSDAELRNAI